MREVSDILDFGGPVAFDEVTPTHEGKPGTYKGICPWCTIDLETVQARTFGELYDELLEGQINHMDDCEKREATEMDVEVRGGQSTVWN
jgi:hypothetical protein